MAVDIRKVKDLHGLVEYFASKLYWNIDFDDFEDIEDITYDFDASDIGLKEEAFAKISALRQLPPLVDGQRWGIFSVEFDSKRFEVTALRKILSGLIPKRRNAADHAVWAQQDLLFLCFWGKGNERTIGIAHFADQETGLPQIRMIYCAPAVEDFTQIMRFEERLSRLQWPDDPSDVESWRGAWSSAFRLAYRQTITDSSTLTLQLAVEAQDIRDRIMDALGVEAPNGYVHTLYDKFKRTLIHDMTEQQFADMYAQTVVYGLFSARCMDTTQDDFSASEAVDCIPNTNPFLKHLMQECLGAEQNSRLSFDELEIGDVVELLRHTQTEAIIQDFNRQTGGGREDPVIHFYEEFLTAYDKAQKVQRGVFYTPQPVVNFIVRAVDDLLKGKFGVADGLASTDTKKIRIQRDSKRRVDGLIRKVEDTADVPAIQVLDPSTGTGTFLRQIILQTYANYLEMCNEGRYQIQEWSEYVEQHLLPRLNGFELMMAPYAVAHMKLAMVLKDTGYDFSSGSRLNLYLTNTLEKPGTSDDQITFWDDPLAAESIEANKVKKNVGINIVIGNPPYSTESSNKGEWITELMESYKREADGVTKLKERNSKPINDDYIKFIRFGQEILMRSNQGILAFINPHGFLDGPIFRGMRTALMRAYSDIYILDLHGNANRQETTPDGEKDENVFDIKQGVCIILLVKDSPGQSKMASVYRYDVWGTREQKYQYLLDHRIGDIAWRKIEPNPPLNLFIEEDSNQKAGYENGISLRELFTVNGTGVLTKRDELCVHFTGSAAYQAAIDMAVESKEMVVEKYHIPADVRDWKYEWAKHDVIASGPKSECVRRITYRPFDIRYTYYTGQSRGFMGWPVHAVMQHMINTDNLALVTARSNKAGNSTHFYVSKEIVEYKCGERTTNSSVFPLYLCEDGYLKKTPNFNADVLKQVAAGLQLELSEKANDRSRFFSPFDLFSYLYAVLYSPGYRERYGEFLNRDFPIVPYPKTQSQFWTLSDLGQKLISEHLMQNTENSLGIEFVGNETFVDKVAYLEGKVIIAKNAFFSGVPQEAWDFMVGGYQPCQRWLKERRGYVLDKEDLGWYIRIVNSLYRTVAYMESIDKALFSEA